MKHLILAVVLVGCLVPPLGIAAAEEGPAETVALEVRGDKATRPDLTPRFIAVAGPGDRHSSAFGTPFSQTVVDDQGLPLGGAHDLLLSYFEPGGEEPIRVEAFPKVDCEGGRFDVVLGAGGPQGEQNQPSLQVVFESHPELELEVKIDAIVQAPRVRILPAGHSPETRAMLSGAVSKDERMHTKGYKAKSETTSVQAATLRPSDGKSVGTGDDSNTLRTSPFLIDTIYLGTSIPVRDMVSTEDGRPAPSGSDGEEINPPRHENIFDKDGYRFGTRTVKIDDPLAKESQGASSRATPGLLVGFEGISSASSPYAPPDTEGTVGPSHYVQVINVSFQVYDKTGTPQTGILATNTLWSGFGGLCESDNNGDAIFMYDEPADRWVLTQFTSGNVVCFAVSTTGDPTGPFELYQVNTQKFPDYYKLGVWPDPDNNAYFMGTNTGYQGDYDIYAIDRENMLAGSPARSAQYFQDFPNLLMPADLDGDNVPPAGQPGIFFTFRDGGESYFIPSSPVDTLDIWEFDVDWNAPANTTFSMVHQIQPPELADFNWTICGFFNSDCLSQPGTTQKLDSASWWPMQRLQYRNFGNYEALVSSWTVDVGGSGGPAAPRWFELRRMTPSANWSMAFQGTFSPDGADRWMPSVALDGSGNMAMGFSVVDVSPVIYPSLRYATRPVDASAFDAEATMVAGGGSETTVNRWGDYASMDVDPADDCTFWFTSEYIKTTGGWNWSTYVGAFKVPGCTGSTCDAEAPTGLNVYGNGDNQIDMTWNSASGATEYRVYRSETAGGPYTQVGTVFAPTTFFSDTTVSGFATYFYVVTTFTDCEGGYSSEDSASTTGTCLLPPNFVGVQTVTTGYADDPCTIEVEWNQATAQCAGPVSYNVYRDTGSPVTIDPGHRIATGQTCASSPCTYADTDSLAYGTEYFYVVRSVDDSNAAEDGNAVEESIFPTGNTPGFQQLFFDDYDGNRPANADDYYILGSFNGGAVEWHQPETYRSYSTNTSYNFGPGGGGSYARNQDAGLVIGGDGTGPSGANGFVIDQTGFEFSFWHTYNMVATGDGVTLMYSTTGPLTGYSYVPDTVTAGVPYISTGAYNSTTDGLSTESWGGNQTASWTQVVVNLDGVVGETVWFLWRAYTDGGNNTRAEGYYLDDVNLNGYAPGPCTTGGGCTDPGAVTIGSITDDDACAQDGVTITFSGGSGATSFDLWVDGVQGPTGITSPYAYNPGDSGSHSYVVRAIDASCSTDSGASSVTDADDTPGTPAAPGVSDDDTCVQDGVTVTWGAVSGADGYDLRIDGVTTFTGVTSPYSYNPGDAASHTYEVRATHVTCGPGAWSGTTAATDGEGTPSTPAAPAVSDFSSCARDGVQISWGTVGGAASYDLLVDGTTTVVGVPNPYIYVPADSGSHTYSVRAVNVCGNGAWSGATPGSDADHSFIFGGIETAADRDGCDDSGVALRWSTPASWNDGGTGSRSFTAYRDGGSFSSGIGESVVTVDDTGGVNGTSYDYSIEAFNGYGCSAGQPAIQSAMDQVGGAPTFSGLQTVTGIANSVCGLRLDWDAATSNCSGGPTVYNVYRSTSPGFTPDGTSLFDSCIANLYYEDMSVTGGTTYYYIVQAEDAASGHGGPCGDGYEDANVIERSGFASGGSSTWTENFESGSTGWTGAGLWHEVNSSTCADPPPVSPTHAWYYGQDGTCDYATGGATTGTLTSPSISDITASSELSFRYWREVESFAGTYDITQVDVSYDGGSNWSQAWYRDSGDASTAAWQASGALPLSPPTSPSSLLIRFTFNSVDGVSNAFTGWLIDDVEVTNLVGTTCTTAGADPVVHFTARSTSGAVKLEWQNPAGTYGSTRICVDSAAYPTDPANCTVLVNQVGTAGAYDSYSYSGLTNGTTYYYSAFVDDGTGVFSSGRTVSARPFDTTSSQAKWAYSSAATALAPPGLYPGAAGSGAAYGVSNDRVLHSVNSTTGGGDWPRTTPFDWMPMGMNGPAQARPPIVPTTVVPGADLVAFLGSQDGHVYAVDAKTGTTLWQSAQNYGLVQGAPAGIFTAFGGTYDLLFAGSRVAGGGNSMYGINPGDGSLAWTYGGNIGIISSGPTVDYATNRVYFASRENPSGSNNTLWCLSFTETGASLDWSRAYGDIDSAPVLFDGVLYVGTNAGVVVAVDPATGNRIWKYPTNDGPVKGYVDFEFTSVPRKVFFATTTTVWAVTDNGLSVTPSWQSSIVPGPSIPLTLADEGALYLGSTDGWLYQLDAGDGSFVTSVQMGDGTATVGSPGYDWINSLAYVGAENGSVYAVTLPLQ